MKFYRIILKNTGLFGVSQLIQILARLFSNKVAAIFLGPIGIGIIGLLENVLGLIYGFTNFGISESSIREIALADQDRTGIKSKRLISIVCKWALVSGVLGVVVVLIMSKQINKVVFENDSSVLWIVALGGYFLFTSISSIRIAILKAKKRVILIIKYNICAALVSSIIAALGYYFYGVKSIIPVVLLTALSSFLLSLYFSRNLTDGKTSISLRDSYKEGLPMAKLGVLLSFSVIFGQLCFYTIRWFLKEYYSYEVLGVYQVSNTILVGYLGLIFAAMTNEFYPRLCNYENDKRQFEDLINDQTELALLFALPAILALYLIAPFLVTFLYSSEFLNVLEILKVGLFSIILKTIVWPIGFIPLIKGNKKLFMKQNLLGDGMNVLASLCFFYFFGLVGLGFALVVMFLVSGIYNYYVAHKFYGFRYRKKTINIMSISLVFGIMAMMSIYLNEFKNFNYQIVFLFIMALVYSLKHLKKSFLYRD